VFTAYAWIAFYNRSPAYQVWARGITKKKDTHTLDFDVTLESMLVFQFSFNSAILCSFLGNQSHFLLTGIKHV